MITTTLSFTFSNAYVAPAAAPAATTPRKPQRADNDGDQRPAARQGAGPHRLAQAITQALSELGIGGARATPANPATIGMPSAMNAVLTAAASADASAGSLPANPIGSTDATDATAPPAPDLGSAIQAFAHALVSAMRDITGQGRGHGSHSDRRGDGHGFHHRGHGHGYGNMSTRLDALAQSLNVPGSATPAARTPPSSPAAEGSAPAAVPALEKPTAAGTPSDAATLTVAAPAPQAVSTPLVDAFNSLLGALGGAAAATGSDPAASLKAFLQSMSQALRPGMSSGPQSFTGGTFLSVTA